MLIPAPNLVIKDQRQCVAVFDSLSRERIIVAIKDRTGSMVHDKQELTQKSDATLFKSNDLFKRTSKSTGHH